MKKIYCKFETEKNGGETFFTEIDEKTPQQIIDKWLRPGHWERVTLINPIVTRHENGLISVLTGIYALSDEYMKEHEIWNKYHIETIDIYPENDPILGGLGVVSGCGYGN